MKSADLDYAIYQKIKKYYFVVIFYIIALNSSIDKTQIAKQAYQTFLIKKIKKLIYNYFNS